MRLESAWPTDLERVRTTSSGRRMPDAPLEGAA